MVIITLTPLYLLLAGTFMGYVTIAGIVIVAIIGAVIGWKFSNLFIPPRDHWTKSFVAILTIKAGMALTGAYLAVVGGAYLVTWLFGK